MMVKQHAGLIDDELQARARGLIEAGQFLYSRGWVPATSGNFSARLSSGNIAVTVSGRHKGRLTEQDIMVVDDEGKPVGTEQRPSAETLLHTQIYRHFPEIGAILHTHSVNATLLSRRFSGQLCLTGYELLKAFRGVTTHETEVVVPIFPNDQDIPRLAAQVGPWLSEHPDTPGYLISGHGLYTWGGDIEETLRHVEAFEFLFQCELYSQR